ncbi:MAG: rhomboid family intramembrane serine protease [Pseudomonadales bacterium]|nr:rhomboid family intramembrane serine protease [Pseudomonadales bacterium]
MLELHRFRLVREALMFRDYLVSIGIPCRLDGLDGQVRLVILQARDFEKAQAVLADFLNDPDSARFREASWQSGIILPEGAFAQAERSYWRHIWQISGRLTLVVMVLCAGVFLLERINPETVLPGLFFASSWSQLELQPYRLLTPVVLHFSWLHLLFNMLWWWELGRRLEMTQGSWRLLSVALFSAVVSNVTQFVWSGPNFGGLSGVIMGLVGYMAAYRWYNPAQTFGLPKGVVIAMIVIMALGMLGWLDAVFGATANAAHLGGLLSGAILGGLLAMVDRRHSRG